MIHWWLLPWRKRASARSWSAPVLWRFRIPEDSQSGRGLPALQDADATALGRPLLRQYPVTVHVTYVKEQKNLRLCERMRKNVEECGIRSTCLPLPSTSTGGDVKKPEKS